MKIPYGSSHPSTNEMEIFKSIGFDGKVEKINGCYYLNFLQSKNIRCDIEWFRDHKERRALKYIVMYIQTFAAGNRWDGNRTVRYPLIVAEQTIRDKSCCSLFNASLLNIDFAMDPDAIEIAKENKPFLRNWPSDSIEGRIDEVLDQLYSVCNGISIPDGGSCKIHWGNVMQQYAPQLGLDIEDLRNHHFDDLLKLRVAYDENYPHQSSWKAHHLRGIIKGIYCADKNFNYAFLDNPDPSPENSPRARKMQ
ncbi:MAG: hypothetical protein SFW66_07570 [Gammaproteobacteria bacterium]|nr:hypothetical protein [Gammaproteobacteria bacterium]